MSAAKHTPGPWRYFKQGDGTRFHVTARPVAMPGNRFADFATVDIGHEADARLIAAAPEVTDAAAALVARLSDADAWRPAIAPEVWRLALATVVGSPEFAALRAALARVSP
jgi:hypothetical protein